MNIIPILILFLIIANEIKKRKLLNALQSSPSFLKSKDFSTIIKNLKSIQKTNELIKNQKLNDFIKYSNKAELLISKQASKLGSLAKKIIEVNRKIYSPNIMVKGYNSIRFSTLLYQKGNNYSDYYFVGKENDKSNAIPVQDWFSTHRDLIPFKLNLNSFEDFYTSLCSSIVLNNYPDINKNFKKQADFVRFYPIFLIENSYKIFENIKCEDRILNEFELLYIFHKFRNHLNDEEKYLVDYFINELFIPFSFPFNGNIKVAKENYIKAFETEEIKDVVEFFSVLVLGIYYFSLKSQMEDSVVFNNQGYFASSFLIYPSVNLLKDIRHVYDKIDDKLDTKWYEVLVEIISLGLINFSHNISLVDYNVNKSVYYDIQKFTQNLTQLAILISQFI